MQAARKFCSVGCTRVAMKAVTGFAVAFRLIRGRPVGRRQPHRPQGRSRLIQRRVEILEKHGATACVRCGLADSRVLTLDHVQGDGWRDPGRRMRTPQWLDEGLTSGRLQPLCLNCNWIKRLKRQEHPRSPGVEAGEVSA